jgi:hypothetical protein
VAEKLLLFLGAGASATGEAGLPLFPGLRSLIFEACGLDDALDLTDCERASLPNLVDRLAPEALLLLLDRAGVPVSTLLLDLFNQACARPSVVHEIAAAAAADGAAVWTTNYDTLIEEAAALRGRPVGTVNVPFGADPGAHGIVKVHGSLNRRVEVGSPWTIGEGLIYTVPPLLLGLRPAWRERFVDDVRDSHLVVLGYAGADIDMYPELVRAVEIAARVSWFEVADERRVHALADRFGLSVVADRDTGTNQETSTAPRFAVGAATRVIPSADPTAAFVTWARDELGYAIAAGRPTVLRQPNLSIPDVILPPAVRMRLAYQLGVGHALRDDALDQVPGPLRRRLTSRGRGRDVRSRRSAAMALAALGSLPFPEWVAEPARRLASQQRTSEETIPSTRTLLRWLRRRWDPQVALSASHALKFDGRAQDARELAQAALRWAHASGERPDVVGSLSFQYADLSSMCGDFEAARAQSRMGYATASSVVMALWEALTPIACNIAEERELQMYEREELDDLRRLFQLTHQVDGVLWTDLARGLTAKNDGNPAVATGILLSVRDRAGAARLFGLTDRALLQLADIERRSGDVEAAALHLERMTARDELLSTWQQFVGMLIEDAPGADYERVRRRFDRTGCEIGARLASRAGVGDCDFQVNWT